MQRTIRDRLQNPQNAFERVLNKTFRRYVRPYLPPYYSFPTKILRKILKPLRGSFYSAHWELLIQYKEPIVHLVHALDEITNRKAMLRIEKGSHDVETVKREFASELKRLVVKETPYESVESFLSMAHGLAAIDPKDRTAFQTYIAAVQLLNKDALESLGNDLAKNVILHITCEPRIDRAQKSFETFAALEPNKFSQVIVTGNPLEHRFRYDSKTRHLVVPVPDSYEHLPSKVLSALFFIALVDGERNVLKVDDDHRLKNAKRLSSAFDRGSKTRRPTQWGRILDVGWLGNLERVWHFDKCHDPEINRSPYTFPGTAMWATGAGGYLLNNSAIKLLCCSYIYFRRYIESGLYEDLTVSDLIQRQEGRLCTLNMDKFLLRVDEY